MVTLLDFLIHISLKFWKHIQKRFAKYPENQANDFKS